MCVQRRNCFRISLYKDSCPLVVAIAHEAGPNLAQQGFTMKSRAFDFLYCILVHSGMV